MNWDSIAGGSSRKRESHADPAPRRAWTGLVRDWDRILRPIVLFEYEAENRRAIVHQQILRQHRQRRCRYLLRACQPCWGGSLATAFQHVAETRHEYLGRPTSRERAARLDDQADGESRGRRFRLTNRGPTANLDRPRFLVHRLPFGRDGRVSEGECAASPCRPRVAASPRRWRNQSRFRFPVPTVANTLGNRSAASRREGLCRTWGSGFRGDSLLFSLVS